MPVAQKMTDVSLLIFPVEVQKRRIQMIDNIEAPRYQEEASGRGLCNQLKVAGKGTFVVEYDAWVILIEG